MTNKPARVDLASPDISAAKLAAFRDLFPGAIADGVLDATRLGEALDIPVTFPTDGRERFGLTWAGKPEAVRSLLTPSHASLIPEFDKSFGFDTAENVFIEGDNLEVLKLLQKAYNDRVKLVFIDPPYNTGSDFVYNDNFRDGLRGYLQFTKQVDGSGNRISTNVDLLGRRHSRWLSMMYPRLVLARNLLRQDGALFVTIDDNEGAHLRMLLDEVFGPENLLANIAWKHTQQSKNDEPYFSRHWNSILAYRRSPELKRLTLPRTDENNQAYRNPDNDPRGPWRSGDVRSPNPRPSLRYPILSPSGKPIPPPTNGWRWNETSVSEKIRSGEIVFADDETRIIRKIYLADQQGRTPENVWDGKEAGVTRDANREIQEIFGATVFDTPKPTALIRRILQLATTPDGGDIVLDFFAGSGSTAHAVALANAEDSGNRRCMSVNIPEPTTPDSAGARAGFVTVSSITRARIEWVLGKVSRAAQQGLRSFRLGESNFRDQSPPGSADLFDLAESTLTDGRTDMRAVAAQVLLNEGVRLDAQWDVAPVGSAQAVVANGIAFVMTLDLDDAVVTDALALDSRVLMFLEDGFSHRDALKANAFTNARLAGITMKTV